MHRLVLFDLGNVLFYRDKPLINWDITLMHKTAGKNRTTVKKVLFQQTAEFPGVYDYSIDADKCRNIDEEDNYNKAFFNRVFQALGVSNETLGECLNYRKSQVKYKLYPRVKYYLKELRKGYRLGVMTNGRPSRRRVLQQLSIHQFFDDDKIFISDELGFKKPGPQIFRYVTRCLPKKSLVLCDDEKVNLATARSFGWQAILIDHLEKGFEPLEKLRKGYIDG